MKYAISLLYCILVFLSNSDGQSLKAVVKGAVRDSSSQKAMSFVTVRLTRIKTPDLILAAVYTSNDGNFRLSGLDTGLYRVLFSYTGYILKERIIQVREKEEILSDQLMAPETTTLSGVTVTSRKPVLIEQTDDKIIYNTENDPSTQSEMALDILRKTPFVTVDGEGNIQLNGQANFKVLLNGRETAMFARNVKEALRGFPGALISKIEVITSPSAKYDAEGVGGLINIITKKRVAGFNGSISINRNTLNNYNVSPNINFKYGKWGISLNQSINGVNGLTGTSTTTNEALVSSVFKTRTIDGLSTRGTLFHFGNAEISYELDSLNTFSLYGNNSGGNTTVTNDQSIKTVNGIGSVAMSSFVTDYRQEYPTNTVGLDYIHTFKSHKEKEFSIRTNGTFSKDNLFMNSALYYSGNQRYTINNNLSKNNEYTVQADYILPLPRSQKLETGAKVIWRVADADFDNFIKYNPGDQYLILPFNSDEFTYRQNVYSIYGTYHFRAWGLGFRTGLRAEYTSIHGNFASSNLQVQQLYTRVLPNLQISKKFSNAYTLSLGYSQRLSRPYIWNLNPFITNADSLNISYGNPSLQPQLSHHWGLLNRIAAGSTFAGLNLAFSYSDNTIAQYTVFDKTTGVAATTSDNIGREFVASINGNLTTRFGKKWTLGFNGNLRMNQLSNNRDASLRTQSIGGQVSMNTGYVISDKLTATMFVTFFRAPATIQGRSNAQFFSMNSFVWKLLKGKMNLTTTVGNVFTKNTVNRSYRKDSNFKYTLTNIFPARYFNIGLTWNFGRLKENVSKKKGVNNDDLIR